MNENTQRAETRALEEFFRSLRENDGLTPVEADGNLNDAQRDLIRAYIKEYGEAWVGKINLHGPEDYDRPMWAVDAKSPSVYNFEADFVVPTDDPKLRGLILGYNQGGLAGIGRRLDSLTDRIIELGGRTLIWS